MTEGRLRRAVAAAVRAGGRVGAARERRARERDDELIDPDQRARRQRIRTSVDGIVRGLAGRYGLDLSPWAPHEPRDVRESPRDDGEAFHGWQKAGGDVR